LKSETFGKRQKPMASTQEMVNTQQVATFAVIMLSVAGQSFQIIGQGVALIAGIYLGEIFFKSARKLIEAIPLLIRSHGKDATSTNFPIPVEGVLSGMRKALLLATLIGTGMVIKMTGTMLQSKSVGDFFVRISS
jgi:hypothetical protein